MESFTAVGKSLPTKEAALIKQVLKLIDQKKFTKALKKVEKVLISCPDDGDSLSLKGSILNSLSKKEEALQSAKQGVMKNLKSSLSWHILSQVYYTEKNYPEAYKAEQKAFSLSTSNNSIMRSLSLLQLHMRDYVAFKESRRQILLNNFTALINWISFVVAEYLCGSPEKTEEILNSFLKTMEKHMSNQELSETLLFKARILEELKRFDDMLELLNTRKSVIKDTPTWHEYAARAAIGSKKYEEAVQILKDLLLINTENPTYFEWFFEAKQCKSDTDKRQVLSELQLEFPKSVCLPRYELNLLHENIIEKLSPYLVQKVRKGIPSTFNDIKSLLSEEPRGSLILNFVIDSIQSLKTQEAFLLGQTPEGQKEQPQSLMWLLYLHSQILDHFKRYDEALVTIEEAIQHTCTVPDLYLFRGRIQKHMNEIESASISVEEARCLDFADRYLNNKSARYMLRAGHISQAEEIMAVFSKEKANELNVHDMQSMWYELELADAYLKANELEKAANEYRWIEKHLIEMFEDQYDFHFYCYRKMNLNSYVEFMHFIDGLIKHKNFLRAGLGLLRIHELSQDVVGIVEAAKIGKVLIKHHSFEVELNRRAFKVFMKKEKFLLALKCLDKLRADEGFDEIKAEFVERIKDRPMKEQVKEVISRVLNR